nr:MAG TPA: hypothetical protein [Bacteriophage sp.]
MMSKQITNTIQICLSIIYNLFNVISIIYSFWAYELI